MELALVGGVGVAGGVCVAEPLPNELGVGVVVTDEVPVPGTLTVEVVDGVASPLGLCDGVTPEDKLGVGDADTVDDALGDGVDARLLVELGVLVALPVPLPELVGVGVCAADAVVVAVTLPVPLLEGVCEGLTPNVKLGV